MPNVVLKTALFAVFGYVFSLFLVRLVGRKTISQMTLFDFILAVSLGTIAATIGLGPDRLSAVVTLIVFVAVTILIDYLHIRSIPLRKMIGSEPLTVIKNGLIMEENLKHARVTINHLNMMLREKGIFNISDVEFALMETDGKISVLPKSQKQPLTPSDLGMKTNYRGLTRDIILDGTVLFDNLYDVHLDENWLSSMLREQGIFSYNEVFYAGLDTDGTLYLAPKVRKKPEGCKV
ncbi:MAG: YetF domain-containing protein [Chitinophagales bacterium]